MFAFISSSATPYPLGVPLVCTQVRLDLNPMRSPPPEIYTQGIVEIKKYCRVRHRRFKEMITLFARPLNPMRGLPKGLGMRLNPKRLGPKTEAALGGEMGKLRLNDLEEVDRQLDEYVSQCLYYLI